VVVGEREELTVTSISLEETNWVHRAPEAGTEVLVQYRAHGDAFPARIAGDRVDFSEPVDAVAAGQSAAVYSAAAPDELLGGGIVRAAVSAAA
jgi:tRNA U34 2-thiouridine synthase MnmA/TrmU